MKVITADYLFPVSKPPVKNAYVVFDRENFIIETGGLTVGNERNLFLKYGIRPEKLSGILCPGFVNAHCHLELSHLKTKVTPGKGLPSFLMEVQELKRSASEKIMHAMVQAEKEMERNGIVAVGDISNTPRSIRVKKNSGIRYHTFIEIYNFRPDKAGATFLKGITLLEKFKNRLKQPVSLVPHAPYTVSVDLFSQIKKYSEKTNSPVTIHNQECESENSLFSIHSGSMAEMLKFYGFDFSYFPPTGGIEGGIPHYGKSSLQSTFTHYACNRVQLVHNTFTSGDDIRYMKRTLKHLPVRQAGMKRKRKRKTGIKPELFLCLCPKANLFIENRLPDIPLLASSGFPVTIGTDSLASNNTLSVLEELKVISKYFPRFELNRLLSWATINGARFLGFDSLLGTIEPGKQPGINLLKNVDFKNFRLSEKSSVEKIV